MKTTAKYIRKLRNEDGNIEITFEVRNIMSQEELKELEKEKIYLLDIEEKKSKKTNQQNRYLWKLCNLIAEKMNYDNDELEIYCNAIENAGIKADYIMALPETEEILKKQFRVVKKLETRDYNGIEMNVYKLYVGSSKYNREQETKIIDYLLDIAEKLGINNKFWEEVLKDEK